MASRMSFIICAAFLLAASGASRGQDGKASAELKDGSKSAFTGKAIFVETNSQSLQNVLLEDPQVKTLGERTFVVGRVVNSTRRCWIPLSNVDRIEEFADVEEMGKYYKLGRRPEKVP